jgi:hypothetical protein
VRAGRLLAQAGDYRELTQVYLHYAHRAILDDRCADALGFLDVALPAAERLRTPATKMLVLGYMGLANLFGGDLTAARDAFVAQLRLCVGQAFQDGPEDAIVGLAAVFAANGQPEKAAYLFGAGTPVGYPSPDLANQAIFERLERDYFAAARARLGSAAWSESARAGGELSSEQAISYALAVADVGRNHPHTASTVANRHPQKDDPTQSTGRYAPGAT